jgi:hypothetical protein
MDASNAMAHTKIARRERARGTFRQARDDWWTPRSVIDAQEGPALDEFKPFKDGCKPKWVRSQRERLEPYKELPVSGGAAHLLFSAACR